MSYHTPQNLDPKLIIVASGLAGAAVTALYYKLKDLF